MTSTEMFIPLHSTWFPILTVSIGLHCYQTPENLGKAFDDILVFLTISMFISSNKAPDGVKGLPSSPPRHGGTCAVLTQCSLRLYIWRHTFWSAPCDIYYVCLLNRLKDTHDFFPPVIYWMVLKPFKQILSIRWSDFTTQAFGLWKGGCRAAWLNDVNIGGLQLAFSTALEM